MPRNGSGVYSIPSGTLASPNTVIESTKYNTFVADVETDLNAARPIASGGTGATTADAALTAFGGGAAGIAIFKDATVADVRDYLDAIPYVSNRTALAAIDETKETSVFLKEANREGLFEWDGSDLSAQVTADGQQGIYVAHDGDATGATGAWVRVIDGPIYASWFGVTADGSTDDLTAMQAAIDWMEYQDGGTLVLPRGIIAVSAGLTVQTDSITIQGQGRGGTFFSTLDNIGTKFLYTGSGSEAIISLGDGGTSLFTGISLRDFTIDGQYATSIVGWRLNQGVISCDFHNISAFRTATGCEVLGTSGSTSFGNRWWGCTFEHFTLYGVDIYGDGNESKFFSCKFMNTNTNDPTACVTVGRNEAANGVCFFGCDFGATNIEFHIWAYECVGLTVHGCTIEASGNSTDPAQYLLRLGDNTNAKSVDGFSITGNRFLGNSQSAYGLRFDLCEGGIVMGNTFGGFSTGNISNLGTSSDIFLGPNYYSAGTIINSTTGLKYYLDGTAVTYTPTNVTADRSFNADTVAVAELADVVGTLIADLQARKIIG